MTSILHDHDADLYNWADEAVRTDAMQAVYALGKLTAETVERLANLTDQDVDAVLDQVQEATFGPA